MSISTAAGSQNLACLHPLHSGRGKANQKASEPSTDLLLLLSLLDETFTWLKSGQGTDVEGKLEMAVRSCGGEAP